MTVLYIRLVWATGDIPTPQLNIHSSLVTNRFKIGPFREVKRLQEAILPHLVEFGNEISEVQKHFIPIFTGNILLRVNEIFEKFGGKIH